MRIKFSSTLCWPIERQVPAHWADLGLEVLFNQRVDRCDAWIVYKGLYRPDHTICPPDKVIFFAYEPPGLHVYAPAFLAQFAAVVTSHVDTTHRNVILRHQAQPWFIGVPRRTSTHIHPSVGDAMSIEQIAAIPPPKKTRPLSTVCSTKVLVAGHTARLRFLDVLRNELSDQLDVYGYGFRPVADKLEALLPYDFHLVLENTVTRDYWTEKLAEAYLAYCFPIVWGCPNLDAYFPADSFVSLDTQNTARAMLQVKQALAEGMTETRRSAVLEARRRVLNDYNLFEEIIRVIGCESSTTPQRVRLRDESLFRRFGWAKPAVRVIRDAFRQEPPEPHAPIAGRTVGYSRRPEGQRPASETIGRG